MPELMASYVKQGMDPGQAEQQAKSVLSKQAAEIIKGGRVNILWQSISQANKTAFSSNRLPFISYDTLITPLGLPISTVGVTILTESPLDVKTAVIGSGFNTVPFIDL